MRTTVRLDDGLMQAVREHATRRGRTVTSVLEESLRRLLAEADRVERPERVALPVSDVCGGLLPGVDLDDSASLADVMDEPVRR